MIVIFFWNWNSLLLYRFFFALYLRQNDEAGGTPCALLLPATADDWSMWINWTKKKWNTRKSITKLPARSLLILSVGTCSLACVQTTFSFYFDFAYKNTRHSWVSYFHSPIAEHVQGVRRIFWTSIRHTLARTRSEWSIDMSRALIGSLSHWSTFQALSCYSQVHVEVTAFRIVFC